LKKSGGSTAAGQGGVLKNSRHGMIDFDEYAVDYSATLNSSLLLSGQTSDYFDQYKLTCLKKWVCHSNPSMDVLDFGCGIGNLARFLAKAYPRSTVWGYDISSRSIALAKKESGHLNNLDFTSSFPETLRFDLITVANVLHHIKPGRRLNLLTRLRRCLKTEGRLVVFEHNPLNLLTRFAVKTCPFDADAQLIRLCHLIHLAQKSGLRIGDKRYIVFFPKALERWVKIEAYLGFFPLGAQYMAIFLNNQQDRNS
jgi:2-polyprenyl-3-methyl-5-hydroxy-6-metoxy-1,4-benzoquinol methylase